MSLTIREATVADLPALVPLHLKTWRDTYEGLLSEKDLNGPTYEIRERQWRSNFEIKDGSWFCFVVEDGDGQIVGFAVGRPSDHPDFAGELNKIYLLQEYQRQGLGSSLVGHVVRRFLSQGITSMWVYADGRNPSCRFYEALGGQKLDADPALGNYGWPDIRMCRALGVRD